MNRSVQELYNEALRLSDGERASLAARLMESLAGDTGEGVEDAWGDEIQRRLDELDSGAVRAVPWPEARRLIHGTSDG